MGLTCDINSHESQANNEPTDIEKESIISILPRIILINDYVKENDIIRPEDLIIKTTGSNSALKLFIIQSIDRKIQPIDIADSKGIELSKLIIIFLPTFFRRCSNLSRAFTV